MKKSTLTRLLTLTLATLMLLTACGKPPEDTTPEDEYTGLYQPTYLKWPSGMPNVLTAVVSGNNAYAIVGREKGYSIERVTLPDCTMTTLVNVQAEETEGDISILRAVATLCPVPDGLWYGSYTATQDNSDSNLVETTAVYELVHVDDNGNELARLDVTETIGNNNFESIAADNDGNVAIVVGDKKCHAFDKNGQYLFSDDFTDFARLIRSADGDVYLRERMNDYPFTHTLAPVDFEGKKLGDALDITKHNAIWVNSGYGDDDFYLVNASGIHGLSQNGDRWLMLDFARHGILGNGELMFVSSDEKGDLYGLESSKATSEHHYSPIFLQSVENMEIDPEGLDTAPSILQGKIQLTYGCIWLSPYLRDLIAEFNRNNGQYEIIIVNYLEKVREQLGNSSSTTLTSEMITAAREMLILDFTTGKGADIFNITDLQLPREKWSTIALDLYPLLDADAEYSRSSFVSNVLTAMEYKGTLPFVSPSFIVNTMVGKESVFGTEMGWTFDDLHRMQDSLPADSMLIGDVTKDWLFFYIFTLGFDKFINEDGTECYFDSQEFISILELCNSMPETPRLNPDTNDTDELITMMDDLFRKDSILLANAWINTPHVVRMMKKAFDEDVNFIGYPGTGYGASFSSTEIFSISTNCQYPEGAWELIRTIFSPEYTLIDGMPTIAAKLERLLETEMTPLSERTENITFPGLKRGNGGALIYVDSPVLENTPEYDNYHLTQEEVDQFMEVVNAVTRWEYHDMDIWEILDDSLAPFFAGGKSAEETAKEIQSRVSILLAERN